MIICSSFWAVSLIEYNANLFVSVATKFKLLFFISINAPFNSYFGLLLSITENIFFNPSINSNELNFIFSKLFISGNSGYSLLSKVGNL